MERQSTYKFQANAGYRKTLRNKDVDVRRKEKRCNVMMNNRRLPLEERNTTESTTVTTPEKDVKKTAVKGERLRRLKEWQEKRNALREQEKKKQLKPFYAAGSCNSNTKANPVVINPSVSNRPVTRLQIKNAANAFLTAQVKPSVRVQEKPATKKQQKELKKGSKVELKPLAKQRNAKPASVKEAEKMAAIDSVLLSYKSDEAWMPSANRANATTKAVNFDEAFQNKKPLSPFCFGAPSQPKPFNFTLKHNTAHGFVNLSRGCSSSSKESAPASPLCFSYKAADDLMDTPQQEDSEEVLPLDSLATVKRNCLCDSNASDNVLLPIKEDPNPETDSGNVGDNSSESSDNEQDDNKTSEGNCDKKDDAVEEESVSLMDEDSSAAVTAGISGALPNSQEVQRFKDMHTEAVANLANLSAVWEKKAIEIAGPENSDDVLGQIRTTIGQAQLLITKKLKQFLGLCCNAEEDKGERRTTPDDLQGFWDMVSHQIEDVLRKFAQLEEMEKRGWLMEEDDVPKKKPLKKLRGPAKRKAEPDVSERQKQRLAEQREKRAAVRNRLKEMKAAAKRGGMMQEDTVPTDDSVFDEFVSSVAVMELTTPKKKKGDSSDATVLTQVRRSTRKTPNRYRRKSTVSRGSTSEDSDSMHVQPNKALQNTNLIFFDLPPPQPLPYNSGCDNSSGYDFSQYVTPPSPSQTGCLQPTPVPLLLSDDSLDKQMGRKNTSSGSY